MEQNKKKKGPPTAPEAGGDREPGAKRCTLQAKPPQGSANLPRAKQLRGGRPPVPGRSVHLSCRPPAAGTAHPPPLPRSTGARPQPRGDLRPSPARWRPMPVRRWRGAVGEPAPSRNGSALGREGARERRRRGAAWSHLLPGRAARPCPSRAERRGRRAGCRRRSRAALSRAALIRPLAAGLGAGRARCAAPAAGSGYGSRGRRSQCGAAWRLRTADQLNHPVKSLRASICPSG